MEKLLKILVIALVLLSGCKTSRKMTESSMMNSSISTEENRSVKANDALKIDNDIASDEETGIEETKIEFYPPTEKPDSGSVKKLDSNEHGAIKSITTTKTTKKKKDTDKSKVAAASENQENTSVRTEGETEVKSQKAEVKTQKIGVAWWKIVLATIAALVAVYFLVRKNIIRIGFLTKVVAWIDRFLGLSGRKTAQ